MTMDDPFFAWISRQRRMESARKDRDETLAAIQEGLADVRAGRTKPAREVLIKLAKKYKFSIPRE